MPKRKIDFCTWYPFHFGLCLPTIDEVFYIEIGGHISQQ